MAYPTTSDVTALLTLAGVSYGAADIASILAGVEQEWEDRTGWQPFIKDGSDNHRHFDPPCGNRLNLKAGLMSLTSLYVGTDYAGNNGSLLTLNTDFIMVHKDGQYHDGSIDDGQPITDIIFLSQYSGFERSIKITGKWGVADTCPSDVSRAIIRKSAALAIEELNSSAAGLLNKIKEGTVEYAYDTGDGKATLDRYHAEFDRCVNRWKRIDL